MHSIENIFNKIYSGQEVIVGEISLWLVSNYDMWLETSTAVSLL